MITRQVETLIFTLAMLVPETVEEYNNLAPKRTNPCLEDAVSSTLYRNVFNKFRAKFCEELEKQTQIKMINSGTEDDPKWESELKYIRRVIVEVAKARGLDPAAKATTETLATEWTPLAQAILNGIKFDPSEVERKDGGSLVAKTYIDWAKKAYESNKQDAILAGVNKLCNTTFTLGENTDANREANILSLAKAIAANEKRKRDIENAKAKAEYGLEG